MVITGALQTIRNVWPDVLATIIDLLWQLLAIVQNAPKFTEAFKMMLEECRHVTECGTLIRSSNEYSHATTDPAMTRVSLKIYLRLTASGAELIAALIPGYRRQLIDYHQCCI